MARGPGAVWQRRLAGASSIKIVCLSIDEKGPYASKSRTPIGAVGFIFAVCGISNATGERNPRGLSRLLRLENVSILSETASPASRRLPMGNRNPRDVPLASECIERPAVTPSRCQGQIMESIPRAWLYWSEVRAMVRASFLSIDNAW